VLTRKPIFILLFFLCVTFFGVGSTAPREVRADYAAAPAELQAGPVQTLPPNEDGSITHVIQYGETLVNIADAYGISLQELYNRNNSLNPAKPVYFEGQVLIISPPFTATPRMTQTYTPNPPTRTPLPTRTLRPTYTATTQPSPSPSRTPTDEPLITIPTIDDLGSSRPVIAYTFIGVSLLGLIALYITSAP
jgi:LysM repeat protein